MVGSGKLVKLLQSVRGRMRMLLVLRTTAWGAAGGLGAAVLLLLASRVFPLPDRNAYAIGVACVGLVAGLLVGLLRQITLREAALAMDRHVTCDAVTTALEQMDSDHPVARLQREDAEQAATRYVAQLQAHMPGPGRSVIIRFCAAVLALVVGVAVLMFVPNPMDERLAARAAAADTLGELVESIDALKEMSTQSGLPQEGRMQLDETLDAIRDRLARLNDPAEAQKAIAEAKRQMERLAADLQKQETQMNALAQQMQSVRQLQALGQALESQDAANVEQAAAQLRDEVQRLSEADKTALAERLKELAEQMAAQMAEGSGDAAEVSEAVQQALERAAAQLQDRQVDADAIGELGEALAEGLSAAQLEALAQQLAAQLGQMAAALAAQAGMAAGGTQSADAWSGVPDRAGAWNGRGTASGLPSGTGSSGSGSSSGSDRGDGGEGSGSGQGNGESNGEGSGTGASQGAGSGSGAGQGAGAGSGAGQGAGAGSGSGQGAGTGSGSRSGRGGLAGGFGDGSRTLVTTPRSLQGTGNVEVDGGPSTGGEMIEGGQAPVLDGGLQSYEEVYAAYAAEARQSLNRSQLPPAMQQRVRDYFDHIQPNR